MFYEPINLWLILRSNNMEIEFQPVFFWGGGGGGVRVRVRFQPGFLNKSS